MSISPFLGVSMYVFLKSSPCYLASLGSWTIGSQYPLHIFALHWRVSTHVFIFLGLSYLTQDGFSLVPSIYMKISRWHWVFFVLFCFYPRAVLHCVNVHWTLKLLTIRIFFFHARSRLQQADFLTKRYLEHGEDKQNQSVKDFQYSAKRIRLTKFMASLPTCLYNLTMVYQTRTYHLLVCKAVLQDLYDTGQQQDI